MRRYLGLAVLGLVMAVGCERGWDAEVRSPMPCPAFAFADTLITVDTTKQTVTVGEGEWKIRLDFKKNSVPSASQYMITPALFDDMLYAGMNVEALPGSPSAFSQKVKVRFDYEDCASTRTVKGIVRYDSSSASWVNVPGSKKELGKPRVKGEVDHFSAFAVAM